MSDPIADQAASGPHISQAPVYEEYDRLQTWVGARCGAAEPGNPVSNALQSVTVRPETRADNMSGQTRNRGFVEGQNQHCEGLFVGQRYTFRNTVYIRSDGRPTYEVPRSSRIDADRVHSGEHNSRDTIEQAVCGSTVN